MPITGVIKSITSPDPKTCTGSVDGSGEFLAEGFADGDVGFLHGVLAKPGTKFPEASKNPLFKGQRLGSNDRPWSINFSGLREGDSYVLWVWGTDAKGNKVAEEVSATFKLVGHHLIGITSPQPDTHVTSNFTARGSSDATYPVSGTMSNGQFSYNGTTLQGPPASQTWYIQFTGVAVYDRTNNPNPYTLTVTDTNGSAKYATGLTVDKNP